jgi:hypothetical protein
MIRAVQYVRMLLKQCSRTFDIALFADVAEFPNVSQARIRLGHRRGHQKAVVAY